MNKKDKSIIRNSALVLVEDLSYETEVSQAYKLLFAEAMVDLIGSNYFSYNKEYQARLRSEGLDCDTEDRIFYRAFFALFHVEGYTSPFSQHEDVRYIELMLGFYHLGYGSHESLSYHLSPKRFKWFRAKKNKDYIKGVGLRLLTSTLPERLWSSITTTYNNINRE